MSDLFKEIIDITKRDKKDFFQTYAKIGEESGELAKEIQAYSNVQGYVSKHSNKTNIIEECIDTALASLSLAVKAGATEDEMSNMFRAKMNKWADILNNEGRLKDITNIPYEVHITVAPCDIESFKLFCSSIQVKAISLDLISSNNITNEIMTSSNYYGTNSSVIDYCKQLQIKLKEAGYTVLRAKIETVPFHPLAPQTTLDIIPQGSYFECHIEIKSPTVDFVSIANRMGAKVSKNIMKKGNIYLLTLRKYTSRIEFEKAMQNLLIELDNRFICYDKPIVEFALYDSNVNLDEMTLKHSLGMGNWTPICMKLEQDLLDLGCKILQMKEKLGELRVYYNHVDYDTCEKADALIEKAIEDCYKLDEALNEHI